MVKKALVLGGGFAGLVLWRALLRDERVEATLVDQNNYHIFQPLLYQVATGELESSAVTRTFREIAHRTPGTFILGEVTAIDPVAGTVTLDPSRILTFDYLYITLGTVTNFFGNGNLQCLALDLKNAEAAEQTKSRIAYALERAATCTDREACRAWLTFAVAGGGPAGVEFCCSLAQRLHRTIEMEYPGLDSHDLRIVLIQGGGRLLEGMADPAPAAAAEKLESLGVEVFYGHRVTGFDGEAIRCGGEGQVPVSIPARTLVWTAGVHPPEVIARMAAPKTHDGRLVTDPHLRLPGYDNIFVAGDLAGNDRGLSWPQTAPFAIQSARHALRVTRAMLDGGFLPEPFSYSDPGSMVTLGRFDAICIFPQLSLRFGGIWAWMAWTILHLYRIIGMRNRFTALLDWFQDYVLHDYTGSRIDSTTISWGEKLPRETCRKSQKTSDTLNR